ncbi:MAG: V-type ATP synthase subunit E [Clostridia bacterium]|nr:V-type ATP synthase subunit E [Clostridia bacterium]
MASVEDKLTSFSAFVLQEAKEQSSRVIEEIEYKKNEIVDKKELELLTDAYERIQKMVSKYSRENNERVLKVEMGFRKELLVKREQIMNEVFSEVIKKINEYVDSPDYKNWLVKKIESACAEVGEGNKIVYITEKDSRYRQEIEKDNVVVNTVCEDDFLGGARVYNSDKKIFADYSIKQMLEDEKHNFLKISGLALGL